ncbi:thioredoxin-dependent thiol peroxidase [Halalkalicoccus paucihalophilus]|uniref:Thioredoxin-dependent thiol peroxidase n=1 Tax=Halalkalicoccus paucihalophilus TaxID=1008153 RepID=A0A151ACB1_9EURY|nr:thioredoxin family protein [Halalkalicoccus paucihalophilus]KYH25328.1 thioredoxin-dependent thiol peroxidase [Halalkalicoccus paucihalophilus]
MALQASDSDLERGDPAPAFELPGTDGETYSVDDFADRDALLVVFTCNHCPYAKAKIEPLNDIAAEYDDVAVVGINPNDAETYPEDSFERMTELVEAGTVAYDAYLRDESQEVARSYGAVCTPDPFLFRAEEGEFRLAYHGRVDDAHDPDAEPTEHDLREAIESVLGGEAVTVEERPSRGCSIKWREAA